MHVALLFAGMLHQRRNTDPQVMCPFASRLAEISAGLQYLTHLEGLSIRISPGKAEDGTWTACFLHGVLKVCLSTVAGSCLLAIGWCNCHLGIWTCSQLMNIVPMFLQIIATCSRLTWLQLSVLHNTRQVSSLA